MTLNKLMYIITYLKAHTDLLTDEHIKQIINYLQLELKDRKEDREDDEV